MMKIDEIGMTTKNMAKISQAGTFCCTDEGGLMLWSLRTATLVISSGQSRSAVPGAVGRPNSLPARRVSSSARKAPRAAMTWLRKASCRAGLRVGSTSRVSGFGGWPSAPAGAAGGCQSPWAGPAPGHSGHRGCLRAASGLGIGGQHLNLKVAPLASRLPGLRMVAVVEIDDDVADIDRDARG
jgi:hypothetical protein